MRRRSGRTVDGTVDTIWNHAGRCFSADELRHHFVSSGTIRIASEVEFALSGWESVGDIARMANIRATTTL
eukprot:3202514-Pyramimonas_sp.AAC.1